MMRWTVNDPLPEALSPEDLSQLETGDWFNSWLETGPYTFAALNKALALGDMLGWTCADIVSELHDLAPNFKMPEFEKLLKPYEHLGGGSKEAEDKAIVIWNRMAGDWHFKGYWLEQLDEDQCAALARWIDLDHRRASCLLKRAAPESVLAVVLEARRSWKRRVYPDNDEDLAEQDGTVRESTGSRPSRDRSPTRK